MTTVKFIRSASGETSVYVAGQAPLFKADETVLHGGVEHTVTRAPIGEYYQLQADGAKHYVYAQGDDLLAENPRPMAAADLLAILLSVGVDMDSLIAAYVESKESEAV